MENFQVEIDFKLLLRLFDYGANEFSCGGAAMPHREP
jgi:hypothetical protein